MGLRIWGGESTVRLPAKPGRGGRNQHLALAAARLLVSHDELTMFAAGTDGTDGVTSDAGAIVDSETVERGTLSGLDADDCLARADSGAFWRLPAISCIPGRQEPTWATSCSVSSECDGHHIRAPQSDVIECAGR